MTGLLLLTLSACGAKPAVPDQSGASRTSGGRSGVFVVDTLVQNSADAGKTRRAALLGVFVSHFISTSPTAIVNSGIGGIAVQNMIFQKQNSVTDPDFDLIQAFADALQVDVLDLLNRSLDRQATLDIYVDSLNNIAERANNRLNELVEAQSVQKEALRELSRERSELERELRNATSDKDYLLANEKQKLLNDKEREFSEAELELNQVETVMQTLEDLLALYSDKILAIQENREPLIAGTKVVDLPGTSGLNILERRGGSSGTFGGSNTRSSGTSGGSSGGASTGGSTSGGSTGGASTGGDSGSSSSARRRSFNIFGNPYEGLVSSSSSAGTTGGAPTGGASTGGSSGGTNGGASTGGSTGSASTGGASTGGSSGGASTGGSTGGASTGGTTGGATTGGASTSGGAGERTSRQPLNEETSETDVGILLEGGSVNDLVALAIALGLIAGLFLSMIYILVGGIKFIISAGNEEAIKKAVGTVRYAVAGLVVCLLAYFIIWGMAQLMDVPFDLSFDHILDIMRSLYTSFNKAPN